MLATTLLAGSWRLDVIGEIAGVRDNESCHSPALKQAPPVTDWDGRLANWLTGCR